MPLSAARPKVSHESTPADRGVDLVCRRKDHVAEWQRRPTALVFRGRYVGYEIAEQGAELCLLRGLCQVIGGPLLRVGHTCRTCLNHRAIWRRLPLQIEVHRKPVLAGLSPQFVVGTGADKLLGRFLHHDVARRAHRLRGHGEGRHALANDPSRRCEQQPALFASVCSLIHHSYIVATLLLRCQQVLCGCNVATNRLQCEQWRKLRSTPLWARKTTWYGCESRSSRSGRSRMRHRATALNCQRGCASWHSEQPEYFQPKTGWL